jgi:hypothetical protein
MSRLRTRMWLVRLAPALGLLWVASCMTNIEHNLDMVLSPGALDNALVLPYSAHSGLAELFIRLFFG